MTAHVIRVTPTTLELLHPLGCVRPCDEGDFEERYGLDRWKTNGDWPVHYWAEFRDGEFLEDLVLAYEIVDMDDYHERLDATAGEVYDGPVRGDIVARPKAAS